jgi:hypothetical protein
MGKVNLVHCQINYLDKPHYILYIFLIRAIKKQKKRHKKTHKCALQMKKVKSKLIL